jgi:hypothetical protein
LPDGLGGAGVGGASGLTAALVVYLADRLFGTGKQVRQILPELEETYLKPVLEMTKELHTWHDVQDPSDNTQKIWWFTKALRQTIAKLVERFGVFNRMLDGLTTVAEKLLDSSKQLQGSVDELKEIVQRLQKDVEVLRKEWNS